MGFVVFEREAPRDLGRAVELAAAQLSELVGALHGATLTLRIGGATLTVEPRAATDADRVEADARARACGAAGLELLARRCARVHRVARDGGVTRDELVAQATLALALLGPVMPDDEPVIYGVRGARARLTATARAASSR